MKDFIETQVIVHIMIWGAGAFFYGLICFIMWDFILPAPVHLRLTEALSFGVGLAISLKDWINSNTP